MVFDVSAIGAHSTPERGSLDRRAYRARPICHLPLAPPSREGPGRGCASRPLSSHRLEPPGPLGFLISFRTHDDRPTSGTGLQLHRFLSLTFEPQHFRFERPQLYSFTS